MQSFLSILAALSYLGTVDSTLATPVARSTLSNPVVGPQPVRARDDVVPDPNPCGTIIDWVNTGYAYFAASMAFDCLKSVPFNPAVGTRFVNYVNTTIQFQSTLAYLKNPPKGYQQPPVDLLGDLQEIQNNITAGYYLNQYAFEAEVQKLLYSAHDAHLSLTAGAMAAFSFLAPFKISAASIDGKALPKVYVTDDIIQSQAQGWNPSAIQSINGQNITEFLTDLASLNGFGNVDPHADWNQLFTTPALDILGDESLFFGYLTFYPGKDLVVMFENSTEPISTIWVARYNEPYHTGPLTTGGDFYNYFVLNHLPASFNQSAQTSAFNAAYAPESDSAPNNTLSSNSWQGISQGAYPKPDIYQPGLAVLDNGVVSGYFLQDVDAAVLSLPTFDQTGFGIGNFSQTVADFLGNATEKKIKRAVIDLQQNSGGTVELAFSTFKRFFPDVNPYAGSRRRSHYLGNILGESYTARFDNLTKDGANDVSTVANEWVITPRVNAATKQNFTGWAEYYGSLKNNGDHFSLTERYNLSSTVFDRALFDSYMPWGYTYRYPEDGIANYQRPFKAENIVLLTDGACSSACALLVELFTQAGASTIVVGGRPVTGPMQAVGGNRGAAIYSAVSLDKDIAFIGSENATAKTLLPILDVNGQRDQGVYTTLFSVNLRDQVRENDPIPLQFKYEAADCRIFYTLANIYNMNKLWRDVVAAAFDDKSLCVEGSTGFRDRSKPPPAPPVIKTLSVHHGSADGQEYLPGSNTTGLTDFEPLAKGSTITSCENDEPCAWAKECRIVEELPCTSTDQRFDTKLCLNDVPNKDFCTDGSVFRAAAWLAVKQVPDYKGIFQAEGTYTGFCVPATAKAGQWKCPKH